MKIPLFFAAAATVPGALVLAGAQSASPTDPGKFFTSTCLGCHVPPDPAFKADHAWLGQVPGTA